MRLVVSSSIVLLALLSACSSTRERGEPGTPAPRAAEASLASDHDVEVIPLKYAIAKDVANVVESALRRKETRIVADQRTNSVVVSGSRADIAAIQDLVARLDVPVGK